MTSFIPPRTPSVSSSEDGDDDETYDDWISASGDPRARSLFDERELANIAEALQYDRDTYGFDLGAFSKQLGMPDHGCRTRVGPDPKHLSTRRPSKNTARQLHTLASKFHDRCDVF